MAPNGREFERGNPDMARSFRKLSSEVSPDARERVNRRARSALLEMTLEELRQNASGSSQDELKELLKSTQDAILQLEGRQDPLLGNLAKSLKALGGDLELIAHFPDADVRITQFDENDDRTAATGT